MSEVSQEEVLGLDMARMQICESVLDYAALKLQMMALGYTNCRCAVVQKEEDRMNTFQWQLIQTKKTEYNEETGKTKVLRKEAIIDRGTLDTTDSFPVVEDFKETHRKVWADLNLAPSEVKVNVYQVPFLQK